MTAKMGLKAVNVEAKANTQLDSPPPLEGGGWGEGSRGTMRRPTSPLTPTPRHTP